MANGIASSSVTFTSSPDQRASYQGDAGRSVGRVEEVLAIDVTGEQTRLHQRLHRVCHHRRAPAHIGDMPGGAWVVLREQFRDAACATVPTVTGQRRPVADPFVFGGERFQPIVLVESVFRRNTVVERNGTPRSDLREVS